MRITGSKYILYCVSILLFASCSKLEISDQEISECTVIMEVDILSNSSPPNECNYNVLYRYKGAIYYTCVCCECNKIDMAFDCDGVQLCDFSDDCMIDFNHKADLIGYFFVK